MRRGNRYLVQVFLLLLAACAGVRQEPAPVVGDRPRLVVVITVDGLPANQVTDYWAQLAPDGFVRFLDRGAWFSEAYYGYSHTVTCAGHATLLTGAYPHRSGIIGNQWVDPDSNEMGYCAEDPDAKYIGHPTHRHDGTSPARLRVESLGDVLKHADARSKVISISMKDRGAIMLAGRSGTAYWYRDDAGTFGSTTYYMKEHPAWLEAFNAAKPADAYFHKDWRPLFPESAYARDVPDSRPWFAEGGKLPKRMAEKESSPGKALYGEILASPFADDLLLALARAAIAGEGLGRDDAPDILAISLSSHDYVNHAYGPESRLSHDHVLYLDRALQEFFNDLDVTVGRDQYIVALTADHGFTPAPEYSRSVGHDGGRVSGKALQAALDEGLAKRFGPGPWVRIAADSVVINRRTLAERKADAHAVAEEAQKLLRAQPGIAAAYTRAQLSGPMLPNAPYLEAMRKSWHPDRSGDVQFALKAYWVYGASSTGSSHGSPHAYDTHVPLLLYGPPWIRPGRVDRKVEIADLAPTLARLLRVPPPSASEGRLLPVEKP